MKMYSNGEKRRRFRCRRCRVNVLPQTTRYVSSVFRWQTRGLVTDANLPNEFLQRMDRSVPYGLPQEMREDILQELMMEVLEGINRVVANVPEFIRKYKKEYPFRMYSLDDPYSGLAERLVG
jgi:hypothetical protein